MKVHLDLKVNGQNRFGEMKPKVIEEMLYSVSKDVSVVHIAITMGPLQLHEYRKRGPQDDAELGRLDLGIVDYRPMKI